MHKTGKLKTLHIKFPITNMGDLFRQRRGGGRLIEEGLESEVASMKETVSLSGDVAQAKATEAADEGEEKVGPSSEEEKVTIAEQPV